MVILVIYSSVGFIVLPNDPSSATRRKGRNDGNRDALAGFAAAHGWVTTPVKQISCFWLSRLEASENGCCQTSDARYHRAKE